MAGTKNIKSRLKNWITTTLGVVIILASIASVFIVPGMSWEGAAAGIALGSSFLFMNDPKILKRLRNANPANSTHD